MTCQFSWKSLFCVLLSGLANASIASGPLEQVPNNSLTNLPAAPPTFGFTATNFFPSLVFTNPTCMATPPGETNRLFIAEKRGRIVVITNLASPTRTIFMDITDRVSTPDGPNDEEGLLGLAFHPGYATNGFFYVYYTGPDNTGVGGTTRHDILSRFTNSAANPNLGVPGSEQKILRQRDQASNHNGGDIHFGADGYLYLSLGDEGNGDDSLQNSQRITNDFFSAMVRMDVDKRVGNLTPNPHPAITSNYLVPADNPFVRAANFNGFTINSNQVRTEFWAVGLRNPWRWSFDEDTDILYLGDVGQSAREEINIIEKGKNYGWNYWEGNLQRTNSGQIPAGFVHARPLIDFTRSLAVTIIGGRVYRGQNLSQLYGAYVYADSGTGRIWALRHTGTNVTQNTQLFTDFGISAFGADPRNGDLLYAAIRNGINSEIRRIVYNNVTNGAPLPATLAGTGAFADLTTLEPNPGIVPYDINVPFWSDNAMKTRWFSLPNTNLTIGFNPDGNWAFPTGMVWIKHFELELTNGVPESRKRLETRLLVRNSSGVYGITYRWGDSTSNATLVGEEGMDESFVVDDGGGIVRTQVWHYPSRLECLRCHTAAAGLGLGFNTEQLNRIHNYDGDATNQIMALSQAGYFTTNVPTARTLRALSPASDASTSLEYRVRSYLAANCVQCHQSSGPAQALWDARIATSTSDAGIINGPLVNNGGDTDNRVIAPGSLPHSMLLTRISTRGAGQMPPLASNVLDTNAIALLSEWITSGLDSYQSFADWQLANFGSTNEPGTSPGDDFDGDGAINELEYLTATSPTNNLDAWTISMALTNDAVLISYPQIANRGFEIQSTDGFIEGGLWSPLDAPGNEPFFSVTNRTSVISDAITETNTFYRVRVFEP